LKLFGFLKRILSHPVEDNPALADDFEEKFGYRFNNIDYLIEALTHRSYVYVNSKVTTSSERLEFLGDSILGLVVSEYLFNTYPDYHEGDLTKTKALLVNEVTLAMAGRKSRLSSMVLMSQEEEKSGGRRRNSIISDAMEAVIGALYLDGGIKASRDFIYLTIISRAEDVFTDSNQINYKGELLEYMQRLGEPPPYYEVISEEGPDHHKTFNVVVKAYGKIYGQGSGYSKKEAEQKAASQALETLNGTNDDGK
jgi:ribonuclease-3